MPRPNLSNPAPGALSLSCRRLVFLRLDLRLFPREFLTPGSKFDVAVRAPDINHTIIHQLIDNVEIKLPLHDGI